ncbi:MAG: hypothetical protein ACLP7P_00950 [Rhodomicrobium sp.]
MQARLLFSATFIVSLAPLAAAQQFQTQQQVTPQQVTPQPAKPPKPPAVKPKPAPAAKKPAPATAPTVKARLLVKIGEWSVFIYEDTGGGGRVCFAAAAPADMQPKTAKRTPVVFYITTWQKDGVRNEVSVRLGYSMKPKSAAVITAGGQHFTLPGDDDKAYTKDLDDERKLLTAMSGGGAMVIKATSAKGTATTDQYSLEGAAAAVQKAQEACP